MPSNLTEYLVFQSDEHGDEERIPADPAYRFVGTATGRDHDAAISALLEDRDPAQRSGRFAAVPARNWRMYDKTVEAQYRSTTVEVPRPGANA